LRGQKAEGIQTGSHFQRVNVTGALCNNEHIAIECYTHLTNSTYFEDWFENYFVKEIPKGCTAITDNAGFHAKERLRKLARGKARLLFLPPYSPDYNQIEKSWANVKRFLRDYLLIINLSKMQFIIILDIQLFNLNHYIWLSRVRPPSSTLTPKVRCQIGMLFLKKRLAGKHTGH
jgi:transposase